ncbi:MAG: IgGFc-binding protein, partial [Bacteroidia bacterium]|nr:IgGFc-binding protein [Bacteroidia bacterium]
MKYKRRDIFIQFLLISLLSCLAFSKLMSQTDTEFWFVAPEVNKKHEDKPILLRLTSYNDAAEITITKPADTSFNPIYRTISPSSTITVDLTAWKDSLENIPEDSVLTRGILIQSTSKITAYYEVAAGKNPDIFTLKGRNALGTLFFVPGQNVYNNATSYNDTSLIFPNPVNAFDIVATQDSTVVTIIPAQDFYQNHLAGIPVIIYLDSGETYSARALSTLASAHLMGSVIKSNKPIAVTFKDDSINTGLCADLIGDQIIPVANLAYRYVVVRGSLETINDLVCITSTTNNNNYSIYGLGVSPVVNFLDSSATFCFEMPPDKNAVYIVSDYRTTVLHVSGFFCETGGAVLPGALSPCNGSSEVAFARTSDLDFMIMLITYDGFQDDFTLDEEAHFDPTAFYPVPGPGSSSLVYGRFLYTDINVIDTGAHRIANSSGTFHLGIINKSATMGSLGTEYGYFSDFAKGDLLGPDTVICSYDSIELDAGEDWTSYFWGPNSETTQKITISNSGTYWVTVNFNNECELTDSIVVGLWPSPDVTITTYPNDTICEGDTVTLVATGNGLVGYLWSTNSIEDTILVTESNWYWVDAWNNDCINPDRDSVYITVIPTPDLGFNPVAQTICSGDTSGINLSSSVPNSIFSWTVLV